MKNRFRSQCFPSLRASLCALTITLSAEAGTVTPTTTDVWDFAQGASVTAHSSLLNNEVASDMFGTTLSRAVAGDVIFSGSVPAGGVHSVEWQTPSPVTVRAFALYAGHDANLSRAFRNFRVLGFDASANQFVELYSTQVAIPYGGAPPENELILCDNFASPFVGSLFRVEFVENGSGTFHGSRIIELDGFVVGLNDGIDDAWQEMFFGLGFLTNPDAADSADPDGDGLSNAREFQMGTDPTASNALVGQSNFDLWDSSAGAMIVRHSGMAGIGHELGMFGGASGMGADADATVFADGQTDSFVHFIEWTTPADVPVKVVNLHAMHDAGPDSLRAFREFRFYARDAAGGVFNLIKSQLMPTPYPGPGANTLSFSFTLEKPAVNNHFRIEFVQNGNLALNGPRVLELDAFAILPVDAIDDAWQTEFFGTRFLSNPLAAPNIDADGDGATNLEEFRRGTDPTNPLSGFIAAIRMAPAISWNSVPGTTYRVKRADTVDSQNVVTVAESFLATETISTFVDLSSTHTQGFYVIEALLPP